MCKIRKSDLKLSDNLPQKNPQAIKPAGFPI